MLSIEQTVRLFWTAINQVPCSLEINNVCEENRTSGHCGSTESESQEKAGQPGSSLAVCFSQAYRSANLNLADFFLAAALFLLFHMGGSFPG